MGFKYREFEVHDVLTGLMASAFVYYKRHLNGLPPEASQEEIISEYQQDPVLNHFVNLNVKGIEQILTAIVGEKPIS